MSEATLFKIATLSGSDIKSDGKNFYSYYYDNGAFHINGADVKYVIPASETEIINIRIKAIEDNIYVIFIKWWDLGEYVILLYKNNVLIHEIKINCQGYRTYYGHYNAVAYYVMNGRIYEYVIANDRIESHLAFKTGERPDNDRYVDRFMPVDTYVYYVIKGSLYRYDRSLRQTRSVVLITHYNEDNTITMSRCAEYVCFLKDHSIYIVKTSDIDFEKEMYVITTSYQSDLYQFSLMSPVVVMVDVKKYMIMSGRYFHPISDALYELRAGGNKISIAKHTGCLPIPPGNIYIRDEAKNTIDIYNFVWDRRYLHLQSPEIKRKVLRIIVLLRRVCPNLLRELVIAIVDMIMQN